MNDISAGGRERLEALLARGGALTPADLAALAALPDETVAGALGALADAHGAAAVPLLTALGSDVAGRHVRRAAKRALYRLAQRGIQAPPRATAGPVVARSHTRAVRAWLSGIDGSGSRAVWILFEGNYGDLRLCSLILNDVAGVLDAAGGEITKKRLDRELAQLRASQKLPWVESDPQRAVGLVAEALARHEPGSPAAPAAFARWRPLFEQARPVTPPAAGPADAGLVERSAELLDLPELAGWFLDPEAVQADAVDLLQARESRLVISDQLKGEREAAIVTTVVERELTGDIRGRWARRLLEMALIFDAVDRKPHGAMARAAAAALLDPARPAPQLPFVRALAARALELAGEVALGRISAAEVSRKPARPAASAAS